MANYANWTTDSEGRFHLGGFFSFIRNIGDVSVLHSIKTELESADDGITAYELADILVEIEPGFGKFRDAIRSIPLGKVGNFLALLLTLISTIIAFQSMKLQEKSSEEDADFQREVFEYQKERDVKQDLQRENDIQKFNDLNRQIEQLERQLESAIKEQKALDAPPTKQEGQQRKLKGSDRNKPCICGSGKKSKNCACGAWKKI